MTIAQSLLIVLVIVFLGYGCGVKKLFSDTQIEGFELFLFKIIIPCYLFNATLSHNFFSLVNLQFIFGYLLSFACIAILNLFYFRKLPFSNICIRSLASGYINAALYTLPVITFLLGDPKAAILSNLIQVIILQSIFIITLSFIRHKEKSLIQKLLSSISNPIVLLPLIGLSINYFQLCLPSIFIKAIGHLGNGASSIALFTFGLSLSNIEIKRENLSKELYTIVFLKNFIHPLVAFIIGLYIFNLDKYWLTSLVIAASAPTAFVVYFIAKQFSVEQNLVKLVIATSSFISLVSLVFIILILGQMGKI